MCQNIFFFLERIHERCAAAIQCAVQQFYGSQHFEAEPLQEGLTGNVTFTSLDAHSSKKHRQDRLSLWFTLFTLNLHLTTAFHIQRPSI